MQLSSTPFSLALSHSLTLGKVITGMSIISYNNQVNVGIMTDVSVCSDANILKKYFEEEFQHLLRQVTSA
jgi:hypothetical protein